MSAAVRYERVGSTSVWTLDRPNARNAIDESVVEALEEFVGEAERDVTLRAVVLTGSGELAFSAGADLKLLRRPPRFRSRDEG